MRAAYCLAPAMHDTRSFPVMIIKISSLRSRDPFSSKIPIDQPTSWWSCSDRYLDDVLRVGAVGWIRSGWARFDHGRFARRIRTAWLTHPSTVTWRQNMRERRMVTEALLLVEGLEKRATKLGTQSHCRCPYSAWRWAVPHLRSVAR
jgi:hypothetical protein